MHFDRHCIVRNDLRSLGSRWSLSMCIISLAAVVSTSAQLPTHRTQSARLMPRATLPALVPAKTSMWLRFRGGASTFKAGARALPKTLESLEAGRESAPPAWVLQNPGWLRVVQRINEAAMVPWRYWCVASLPTLFAAILGLGVWFASDGERRCMLKCIIIHCSLRGFPIGIVGGFVGGCLVCGILHLLGLSIKDVGRGEAWHRERGLSPLQEFAGLSMASAAFSYAPKDVSKLLGLGLLLWGMLSIVVEAATKMQRRMKPLIHGGKPAVPIGCPANSKLSFNSP